MTVWPFMPQREFVETLEWATDVVSSVNSEQRFSLRAVPRTEYSFDYVMTSRQFSVAKLIAKQFSTGELMLPVWMDATYATDVQSGAVSALVETANTGYRTGGYAVVWGGELDWEVLEISAVNPEGLSFATPVSADRISACIAPLTPVRFIRDFSAIRTTSEHITASVTFSTIDGQDIGSSAHLAGYPSYQGHPVVTDRRLLVSEISESFFQPSEAIDNGTGPVWVGSTRAFTQSRSMLTWETTGADKGLALRAWLHSRRGKWRGFWLPSWNDDITVVGAISSLDTEVLVAGASLASLLAVPAHIMFRLKSGAEYFAAVSSVATALAGAERLILSSPVGFDASVGDVDVACFMSFVRFDSDRVELKHKAGSLISTSVPVIEVPQP